MRILVTGAKGQLGRALVSLLTPAHTVTAIDIDQLNITDSAAVMAFFGQAQPELVIHAAALTQVDYCAENPDEALWVNGYGTRNIALACQTIDATLMHISTNEVFDGANIAVYHEYDRPNPINPYGYSKWVAEQMVRDLVARHYIVRTSWLFAHGGRNFIHAILERAHNGQSLRVVVNEVSTPTYARDLAGAMAQLLQTNLYGIYHLVSEGRSSRWDFARYVLDIAGHTNTPIERISSYEYPRASTPPEYAVLRNYAAARQGIVLRHWKEAVRAFCEAEGLIPEGEA
ncbi:MAG: dTDP-4-dehydrorhamnose reductase [Chloroflexi bacterium]|nr:dTDP-4-dehydrorhamnose reductase [Chloroflexota bacterium]